MDAGVSIIGAQDRCDRGPVPHWMGRRKTKARTQESTLGGAANPCVGPRKQMVWAPGTIMVGGPRTQGLDSGDGSS